jgi:flagellar assembly protein FliH
MSVAARSTLFFSQPPKAVYLPGQMPVLTYSSEEMDRAVRDAYEKGAEETRHQLEAEHRKSKEQAETVLNGALSKVVDRHAEALGLMRSLVPRLVVEATSRVVAGIPVDAAFLHNVVNDLLNDVAPGAENVEVQLCPADLLKVQGFDLELRHKFPTLRLVENKDISPGDCLVKTRFGVLDGRMESKLKAVESLLA